MNPQNLAPTSPEPVQPIYQSNPLQNSQYPSTPINENPPRKAKHRVLRIIIGVVIVILLFVVYEIFNYHRGNNEIKSAKVVSDSFMQDLITDNPQAAYQLTSADFQKTTTEAELSTVFSQYKNATFQPYKEDGWQISFLNGSANSAVTQYSLSSSNKSEIDTFNLLKIGGQWEVSGVRPSQ